MNCAHSHNFKLYRKIQTKTFFEWRKKEGINFALFGRTQCRIAWATKRFSMCFWNCVFVCVCLLCFCVFLCAMCMWVCNFCAEMCVFVCLCSGLCVCVDGCVVFVVMLNTPLSLFLSLSAHVCIYIYVCVCVWGLCHVCACVYVREIRNSQGQWMLLELNVCSTEVYLFFHFFIFDCLPL